MKITNTTTGKDYGNPYDDKNSKNSSTVTASSKVIRKKSSRDIKTLRMIRQIKKGNLSRKQKIQKYLAYSVTLNYKKRDCHTSAVASQYEIMNMLGEKAKNVFQKSAGLSSSPLVGSIVPEYKNNVLGNEGPYSMAFKLKKSGQLHTGTPKDQLYEKLGVGDLLFWKGKKGHTGHVERVFMKISDGRNKTIITVSGNPGKKLYLHIRVLEGNYDEKHVFKKIKGKMEKLGINYKTDYVVNKDKKLGNPNGSYYGHYSEKESK